LIKILFILFTSLFPYNGTSIQSHQSLNDSIQKYKQTDPNKAIDFAFEALDLIDYNTSTIQLVSTYSLLGEILKDKHLESSALSYYKLALKTFEAIPSSKRKEKNINKPAWLMINIGNLYFGTKDRNLKKAKEYYLEAEENFLLYKNEKNRKTGLNTTYGNLALIAILDNDLVLAEDYYLEILKNRIQLNITSDIMYSYNELISLYLSKNDVIKANQYKKQLDNLYEKNNAENGEDLNSYIQRNYGYSFMDYGYYYYSLKEYEKAIEYLKKAKSALIKFPLEHPSVSSKLAECYLELNNYSMAQEVALENLKTNDLGVLYKKYNFNVLEKIYQKKKLIPNLLSIKDSLIQLTSFSLSNDIAHELENLELEIILSEKHSELNQNKIKYNTYLFILIIGSSILLFSLLTIRINYNYQKERSARLQTEQDFIKKELEKKQLELLSKTNFIAQRNQYLNILKNSLEKEEENKTPTNLILKNTKKNITRIIDAQKAYEDFENHFNKVYPNFLKELITRFGKLSQTDLRLCAYIKMNQSTNEIAIITGSSNRTIESQKYRLSKKLNIKEKENLNSLIISI
jgi:hypothetical protein